MTKARDLTGKVFGHLTVLRVGDPYINKKGTKIKRWLCQCDCGKKVNVTTGNLIHGSTRSCGHAKSPDLTGQVFGHLTALEVGEPYVDSKGVKRKRWLCQCDCGKTTLVIASNLTSGNIKSCGHAEHVGYKTKHTELVGKQFGHLTVIEDDGTRSARQVMWLCQCDCGKKIHVRTGNLTSGGTTSCGHVGTERIKKISKQQLSEEPGTRLAALGKNANKNNVLGERNISVSRRKYRGKYYEKYRVAVMYKRKQYGHLHDTLEEAIEEREELRRKYWPNYEK